MPATTQQITAKFLTFVQRGREILTQRAGLLPQVESFERFVEAAKPLLLPRLRSSLPILIQRAKCVHRWLMDKDVLAVAGLSNQENSYTKLVAWMLAPQTHLRTAIRRQKAWLQILGIAERIDLSSLESPRMQLRTDDGIPDLILEFPEDILVVEVKTKSVEHTTPSGAAQTLAYSGSVLRRLGRKATPHVVFLTADGQLPENPAAIPTTFMAFVLALATEIAPEELPSDLRWIFSTIFTHLLTHTGPAGVDVRSLLAQVVQWESDATVLDDSTILMSRLRSIQQAMKILIPEARP